MQNLLCQAIVSQNVITFEYDGNTRTVEPYCLGHSSKGNLVLRAFQIAGYSSSGAPFGWRLYDVSKLRLLNVSDEAFSQFREGFNRSDKGMTSIVCVVPEPNQYGI